MAFSSDNRSELTNTIVFSDESNCRVCSLKSLKPFKYRFLKECPLDFPNFNVSHALSCKKGGFVALLTSLLSEVCKNVQVEPHLQPLDNEVMNLRSATTSSDARLDVKAGGFWSRGVTAFFDVRVTHVNSKTNQGKPTAAIFQEQESEKKRKYQQRVLEVEMGSFTPLIFGSNGGMGEECKMFMKHLAEELAEKDAEGYPFVISWLRTRISFEILKSVNTSIRGSRQPFFRSEVVDDFKINCTVADLFL